MGWNIRYYESASGKRFVEEFLFERDKRTIAKITHVLGLLQLHGPLLRFPYAKKIHGNIFELRTSGRDAIRVLYVFRHETCYLLHAFAKKKQKTPKKELQIAIDSMKEIT